MLITTETEGVKEINRPIRIVSKVFDCKEDQKFVKEGKELVLRITPGARQEVKIKFFEDTRRVFSLQLQRYTILSGAPNNTYFTFTGDEISRLYRFIQNIAILPLKDSGAQKINDKELDEIISSKEQALKLIRENPEIIVEVLKNDLTKSDIVALGYRKEQLNIFNQLLNNETYLSEYIQKYHLNGEEAVWQNFFEKNTWILGYGLNYIFNSPLDEKKLEQVVKGYDAFSGGKRVDALLKTRGIINSLCFAEIKTHNSHLLKPIKTPYRGESWGISDELAGGIAQIQKTVQKSIKSIETKTQIKDNQGDLTGEEVFIYKPKSYLIIGTLKEFKGDNGTNEDKFSSFELFRQSIKDPEIITYDELYERAKYIVSNSE
ncbi:MAG TPA: Shedu immune nuclease family protein [Mucilaginibacter sp.]|nr:Shedu immune nuclease family protein [Mucilaginibacter sp.]